MKLGRKKKISKLCARSLNDKWHDGSPAFLSDLCPFCRDVYLGLSDNACRRCLVPRKICDKEARKGFISKLIRKYDDITRVGDISKQDLEKMRLMFIRHVLPEDEKEIEEEKP